MVVNPRYKKELIGIIEKHLPFAKIYLFGSRARGTHSSGADIDLALDINKQVEFTVILKILTDIDQTTIPLKIDLVDINSVDSAVREDILREGVLWKS